MKKAIITICALALIACTKTEPKEPCVRTTIIDGNGVNFEGDLTDFFINRAWKPGVTYDIVIDGTTDECYAGKYQIIFID